MAKGSTMAKLDVYMPAQCMSEWDNGLPKSRVNS
jgi:hypothetical protein